MRAVFFRWLIRNHPQGEILTKFQRLVRRIIFPIHWMIRRDSAYDPLRDIWNIHGKKYTGQMLYELANSDGETFRVSQANGCTILERIKPTNRP